MVTFAATTLERNCTVTSQRSGIVCKHILCKHILCRDFYLLQPLIGQLQPLFKALSM